MNDEGRKGRGRAGEAAAQSLLERHGYRIVDTNVRLGARRDGLPGEIDIVAWDGPTLCFIEVKARRTNGMSAGALFPAESVTPAKQRQIARLALAYSARHGLLTDDGEAPLRFDVVTVLLATTKDDQEIIVRRADLVRGAFLAPDGFDEDP
jgi:putative endonuclease